jgi:hypothetical protein
LAGAFSSVRWAPFGSEAEGFIAGALGAGAIFSAGADFAAGLCLAAGLDSGTPWAFARPAPAVSAATAAATKNLFFRVVMMLFLDRPMLRRVIPATA